MAQSHKVKQGGMESDRMRGRPNFSCHQLPQGYGGAAKLCAADPDTGRQHRVAVVGGGIAGASCAYSLAQSGFDVTIFEARKRLGGNAQALTFLLHVTECFINSTQFYALRNGFCTEFKQNLLTHFELC